MFYKRQQALAYLLMYIFECYSFSMWLWSFSFLFLLSQKLEFRNPFCCWQKKNTESSAVERFQLTHRPEGWLVRPSWRQCSHWVEARPGWHENWEKSKCKQIKSILDFEFDLKLDLEFVMYLRWNVKFWLRTGYHFLWQEFIKYKFHFQICHLG